jgi:hypothetical protein
VLSWRKLIRMFSWVFTENFVKYTSRLTLEYSWFHTMLQLPFAFAIYHKDEVVRLICVPLFFDKQYLRHEETYAKIHCFGISEDEQMNKNKICMWKIEVEDCF